MWSCDQSCSSYCEQASRNLVPYPDSTSQLKTCKGGGSGRSTGLLTGHKNLKNVIKCRALPHVVQWLLMVERLCCVCQDNLWIINRDAKCQTSGRRLFPISQGVPQTVMPGKKGPLCYTLSF